MLLLNLGLYVYQCVKVSNQSSITRMQTEIATVEQMLGILVEDMKINQFEPVYVQQIKLYETSWTTRNTKILNNFLAF